MSPARRVVAAVLLAGLAAAGCQSTQSRAHLPAHLALRPGVTTRREVLHAWGTPWAIRDEPGARTVLSFRSELGEGWAVGLGWPISVLWLVSVSDVHVKVRSAELSFLPDDRLERARLRDADGRLTVID